MRWCVLSAYVPAVNIHSERNPKGYLRTLLIVFRFVKGVLIHMWQSRVETKTIPSCIPIMSLQSKCNIIELPSNALCKCSNYQHKYASCMSPTLLCFECSDMIEIHDGIMFVFYLGLPHVATRVYNDVVKVNSTSGPPESMQPVVVCLEQSQALPAAEPPQTDHGQRPGLPRGQQTTSVVESQAGHLEGSGRKPDRHVRAKVKYTFVRLKYPLKFTV